MEMNEDEVNKARQLFDTEWSKLVVDAEVPKAMASSIEVFKTTSQEQGATPDPFLRRGRIRLRKSTREYLKRNLMAMCLKCW